MGEGIFEGLYGGPLIVYNHLLMQIHMPADHRAFGNILTILKIFKNRDKIWDETIMLTLVPIKIWDEIWDTHLFQHTMLPVYIFFDAVLWSSISRIFCL